MLRCTSCIVTNMEKVFTAVKKFKDNKSMGSGYIPAGLNKAGGSATVHRIYKICIVIRQKGMCQED
jgi:hypothetical protein